MDNIEQTPNGTECKHCFKVKPGSITYIKTRAAMRAEFLCRTCKQIYDSVQQLMRRKIFDKAA